MVKLKTIIFSCVSGFLLTGCSWNRIKKYVWINNGVAEEPIIKDLIIKNFNFSYLVIVLILSLIIRAIMSVLKGLAIMQGEADDEGFKFSKEWNLEQAIRRVFRGFNTSAKVDDYWLTFFLGSVELFSYPILINIQKWEFLGAWIGIKVASTWGTWQKSRTAYTRFLCGNLLVIIASFFINHLVIMH